VAIACVNGPHYIEECLRSFQRQSDGISYELIVADRCDRGCREVVRKFPNARLIEVDRPGVSIPELRAMAIRHARGEFVGITEDHCVAPEGWLAAMVNAHEAGQPIVGGPIENAATQRLVDWAVFLCEYSAFEPPLSPGPGPVPGNNVTYDRKLLPLIDDLLDAGVWEEEFNARLGALGFASIVDPAAEMLHKKSFGFREFLSQRYHYARAYAGLRLRTAPLWRRPVYATFALTALPPLLLGRLVGNVWRKGRHRRELGLTLPMLVAFVGAWACGECVGYLQGPGESLSKVE
jgi:glycosyltransferase involved in cell wall biosynthesis